MKFMSEFSFKPSEFVPYRDEEVLEEVRNIKREDIEKHNNPDFHIEVVPDDSMDLIVCMDMFQRIKKSDEQDEKVVMLLPNPAPVYEKVAYMLNEFEVSCRNLHVFLLDEWANEDGNV